MQVYLIFQSDQSKLNTSIKLVLSKKAEKQKLWFKTLNILFFIYWNTFNERSVLTNSVSTDIFEQIKVIQIYDKSIYLILKKHLYFYWTVNIFILIFEPSFGLVKSSWRMIPIMPIFVFYWSKTLIFW